MIRPRFRWLIALNLAFLILWVALGPVREMSRPPAVESATTYQVALRGFERLRALDDSTINPVCRTQLLTHGGKVRRAVVLLHGFTNCPKQFEPLGRLLYESGCNVLIPRMPHHGISDVMTSDLERLTAEDLVRLGEEAVDIAHGLGDRVTVAGLSSSAVVVAYLAQHRSDIDRAILIAPSFGPKDMPDYVARRITNVLLDSPNFFVWWDPVKKAASPGPKQCYPRFPTHGIAQVYRLGFLTRAEATRERPRAHAIAILTTASDEGVNNPMTRSLARLWRSRGADVTNYEFPKSLGVRHDMIDPEQPYQKVAVTYPVLLKVLETGDGGAAPPGGPKGASFSDPPPRSAR